VIYLNDWLNFNSSSTEIAREKKKARELRQSQWWKKEISKGQCYYCKKNIPPDKLTMDHIVPLARGGRSVKGNVVPCCKQCNNEKKYWTPSEILLKHLKKSK
jgi:5-methylcytosine-specific restriction endonuclease McrA